MNVYVAGIYRRRAELAAFAIDVERAVPGARVCASWLTAAPAPVCDVCGGSGDVDRLTESAFGVPCWKCAGAGDVAELDVDAACEFALGDLEDIRRAHVVVVFTSSAGSLGAGRGGYHVEFGFALALGVPVVLVGDRINIFHALRPPAFDVCCVPSALDALHAVHRFALWGAFSKSRAGGSSGIQPNP